MPEVAKKFPKLTRRAAYKGVAEVVGKTPGKDSWSDDELNGHTSIMLKVLSNDEMEHEIKVFLYGLQVRMSPRAVAASMMLVWNMRSTDPIEERIFPSADAGKDPNDKALSEFEETDAVYVGDELDTLINGISGFEKRRSVAFLAASTLKMFAKDAAGWTKAWDGSHFAKRYEGFTKKAFPLGDLVPTEENVNYLYDAYQGQMIFRGTLGRILYSLADVKDTRQTEMLFEQHLACTGLHIIPQFINAKISIGASTEDLLSALDMQQNESTLIQLKHLINNSLSKPLSPENRGTWRFARLFDQSAFSLLQTKHAQDTVAILANINCMCKSTSALSNPLNIAVLRQMGAKRMKVAKAVAHNIYHYFTVTARASVNEFYDIDAYNLEDSDDEDEEEVQEEE